MGSIWDRYFAPHDSRQTASVAGPLPATAATAVSTAPTVRIPGANTTEESFVSSLVSARGRRQLTIYLAGCTFFGFSVLTTRRAIRGKLIIPTPKLFTPSFRLPLEPANGGGEAAEALFLATMNVASLATLLVGGACWSLDISHPEELKGILRPALGLGEIPSEEAEKADREMEEWMADVLSRKDWAALTDLEKFKRQAEEAEGKKQEEAKE